MLANFSNLITFSRGTNATLVDASGRLTYAPNNLVTNSQDFEAAAWTKGGVTATANSTAAPDGTLTADKLVENTSTSSHNASQTVTIVSGAVYANSVYAKAAGRDWVCLEGGSGAGGYSVWFNLATGSVGTVSGTAASNVSIYDAGNGWYRCSVLDTTTSTTGVYRIFVCNTDNNQSYTGDGTSGIFIWGAQLEAVTYQTTPSPYVSTSVANLLGFSEAFDNAAWTKSNTSIVTGAAQNPINQLWNAQKLMENTATSNHYAGQSVSVVNGTSYTLSFYVKQAGRNAVFEFASSGFGASKQAVFNLSAGTATPTAGVTASISDAGNGWYRCSATCTATSTTTAAIYCIMASGTTQSYTGDGNSGIYIYGAQLSNSGSLDAYVPTPGAAPSSTAYYGPRFDYDPVTLAAKGILIEEARTNLINQSDNFAAASWTANTSTVSPNAAISPDGTQNADRWVSDPGSTSHYLGQTYTSSASISYTFSVWVKSATGSNQTFRLFVQSSVASGDLTASTSWQRFTLTLPSSAAGSFVAGLTRNSSNDPVDLFIYGAQLEAGSFATSYIPTVASTVTRSADVASITGSLFNGWYRQDEGAWVASWSPYAVTGSIVAQISAATNNDRFQILNDNSSQVGITTGGVGQGGVDAGTVNAGAINKLSFAYRTNDVPASLNGGAVVSDTTVTLPVVDRLCIGATVAPAGFLCGHIRNITYIPNRISDAQLQAATS